MASHIVTKLLLASAASLLVQAASAADLAVAPVYNKAPVIAPLASWSGFYIGGNVGYGWGSRSVGLPLTTTDPALAPALAAVVASGARPASLSPSTKGVIGGGQIGYNWQLSSPWLLGLEADLQGSDVKGTATQAASPVGFNATSTSVSKSIDWFGTVRGRVGFLATPQWLLYATGGLAYGETKLGFSSVDLVAGCVAGTSLCASGSSSSLRVGWTAGAGVETMLAPNWSVKVEYLYVDLGRQSVATPSSTLPSVVFTPTTNFRENIVRAGLNYHFNWGGPLVAKY